MYTYTHMGNIMSQIFSTNTTCNTQHHMTSNIQFMFQVLVQYTNLHVSISLSIQSVYASKRTYMQQNLSHALNISFIIYICTYYHNMSQRLHRNVTAIIKHIKQRHVSQYILLLSTPSFLRHLTYYTCIFIVKYQFKPHTGYIPGNIYALNRQDIPDALFKVISRHSESF